MPCVTPAKRDPLYRMHTALLTAAAVPVTMRVFMNGRAAFTGTSIVWTVEPPVSATCVMGEPAVFVYEPPAVSQSVILASSVAVFVIAPIEMMKHARSKPRPSTAVAVIVPAVPTCGIDAITTLLVAKRSGIFLFSE